MTIKKRVDHVERGLRLLLVQYRDKPILRAWIASYLRQVQLLDDAIYDVIFKRLLDIAEGAQLDALGRLVGELRRSRDDETYRIFIRARVRVNRSRGRTIDLAEVIFAVTQVPYVMTDLSSRNTEIEFSGPLAFDPSYMLSILRDTKASGYGLVLTVPTAEPAGQFLWADENDNPDATPSLNGFADENTIGSATTGGLLSDDVTLRST